MFKEFFVYQFLSLLLKSKFENSNWINERKPELNKKDFKDKTEELNKKWVDFVERSHLKAFRLEYNLKTNQNTSFNNEHFFWGLRFRNR